MVLSEFAILLSRFLGPDFWSKKIAQFFLWEIWGVCPNILVFSVFVLTWILFHYISFCWTLSGECWIFYNCHQLLFILKHMHFSCILLWAGPRLFKRCAAALVMMHPPTFLLQNLQNWQTALLLHHPYNWWIHAKQNIANHSFKRFSPALEG